uniref:ankyrin repeat domain-containing protein n=1 Tax=Metallibacterium scheffleri TaxID=993689 RepID=UPI0023F53D09
DVNTALGCAVAGGHAEAIGLLLAHGADVHCNNDSVLRFAAARGHAEIVNLLLAAGANVHASGDDALRQSAANGHADRPRNQLRFRNYP